MKQRLIISLSLLFFVLCSAAYGSSIDDLNNAIALYKKNQDSEAYQILKNLISDQYAQNNIKSTAYYLLAIREKNKEDALLYVSKAIELDPASGKNYELKGTILYGMKKFNESAEFFTKAIETNPTDDKLYSMRGMAYRDAGNFEKAMPDLKKSVELSPRNALYKMRLGKALFLMRNYQDSIDVLQDALPLIQNKNMLAECSFMIAESFYFLNDYANADDYYVIARRNTNDKNILNNIKRRATSFNNLARWNS